MFRIFLLLAFLNVLFAQNFLEFTDKKNPKDFNNTTTQESSQKRIKIPTH
ncbi:MAG: hypothetical protein J1D99_01510 [Campylobacter sp.]|nr:hypothetical protein [Campylobacter sp.]